MSKLNFVFGYGSLVNIKNLEQYLERKLEAESDFVICGLQNYRRCWNVAMDNSLNLTNYKYYRDRHTQERLAGYVAFLNICPDAAQTIKGILFCVSDKELARLDQRERNYQRLDVTKKLDIVTQGRVWTYIGSQEAKQRYQIGLQQNNMAIAQDYFDSVNHAYASLGNQALASYITTTDQPKIPLADLEVCKTSQTIN